MSLSDSTEARCWQALERLPDAVLIEEGGRFVFANTAAARLYGVSDPAALASHHMLSIAAPASQRSAMLAIADLHSRVRASVTTREVAACLDGTTVEVDVTRTIFSHAGRPAVQMVARNAAARTRLESQLYYLTNHDSLTGLANRALFIERLDQAMLVAQRYASPTLVCILGLDRFRWINESFGHAAGDELLKIIALRIRGALRGADLVARLGGDEFALLLHGSTEGEGVNAQSALERALSSVGAALTVAGTRLQITCSVGCCAYPGGADSAEELVMRALAAMCAAKEAGGNKRRYHDPALRDRCHRRARLAIDLQHAIEREQLYLHYQPQVAMHSGDITGMEALLRWAHPELGIIGPAEFIPLAEDTGLIVPIGEWVLLQACTQNKRWQDAGLQPVRVAVNLSPKQLCCPALDEYVARCLRTTGLDPAWLELEFTESASMDDPDVIVPLMQRLKKLGVALSIDDFGTGYSNMQYLKHFPIDRLKLDGSFVREITTDPRSLAIADAIMMVSHRLGLEVVAEMAETQSQVTLLAAHGCDQVQGYFFSPPLPADSCARLLASGLSAPAQLETA